MFVQREGGQFSLASAYMNLGKVDIVGNDLLNCLGFSKHFLYFSIV